jgi:MoaA/NifB/PqqE/SkfB family radical SAM enzyme
MKDSEPNPKRKTKLAQVFYLANYAVKSRISDRFKKPLICSFKITNRCNLKCLHCPFWKEEKTKELNFKEVIDILLKLYDDGVRIVIFEGGEPLLWKDSREGKNINDVIEYSKGLFFYTGITTNGTINLEGFNPDIVFTSIDGLEKTHDRIRGKSFNKIIENIEKNNKNKKIIANICISKENISEIADLVKFLNDKVFGVTIQFFYPYERVKDFRIDDRQKELLLNELISLKKNGFKLLNSTACLKKMAHHTWHCYDFLVSSVESDGRINYGCYLKNKVKNVSCADCGFAAHCEISLAYSFNLSAINTAKLIFWK